MINGVQLKINGVFVDLFGDEEIFFEKRVKDINDINQIFGDRTQPFTLPATEKNNKVFKHYRNGTINSMPINGRIDQQIRTTRDKFSNNTTNNITLQYDAQEHLKKSYRTQSFREWTMNTGLITSSFNSALFDLATSKRHWLFFRCSCASY